MLIRIIKMKIYNIKDYENLRKKLYKHSIINEDARDYILKFEKIKPNNKFIENNGTKLYSGEEIWIL